MGTLQYSLGVHYPPSFLRTIGPRREVLQAGLMNTNQQITDSDSRSLHLLITGTEETKDLLHLWWWSEQ